MAEPKPNIEPLLAGNGQWSAKAVAMDAAQRAEHSDTMLCIWIDADGLVAWSKSNAIPMREAATLAAVANEIAQSAVREYMQGSDFDA